MITTKSSSRRGTRVELPEAKVARLAKMAESRKLKQAVRATKITVDDYEVCRIDADNFTVVYKGGFVGYYPTLPDAVRRVFRELVANALPGVILGDWLKECRLIEERIKQSCVSYEDEGGVRKT